MAIARFAVPALVAGLVVLGSAQIAHADGMTPESSIVILPTNQASTSILVKNTGQTTDMLLVEILPIDEDTIEVASIDPASGTTSVKPGQQQKVTFTLLDEIRKTDVQRLRRVVFEGAKGKPKRAQKRNEVGVTVRQNLPLIIHPAGLELIKDPWKFLKWTVSDGNLTVSNDSRYVVRLSQEFETLPSKTVMGLAESYVLPNQRHTIKLPPAAANDDQVVIHPATVYGFQVDHFESRMIRAK